MKTRRCIPYSSLFSGMNMPGMLVNASRPTMPTGPGYRGLVGIISRVEEDAAVKGGCHLRKQQYRV